MRYFRLNLNPVPWAVGPLSVITRGSKKVPIYGRNQELWYYQQAVKEGLTEKLIGVIEPPFRLRVFFWRRIEQYQTYQARTAMSHEADTTNLIKAFEDALHGVFYTNDKYNIAVEGYIVRQDPDTEPHIIVGIEEVALDYPYGQLFGIPEELLNPPTPDDDEETDKWRHAPDDF